MLSNITVLKLLKDRITIILFTAFFVLTGALYVNNVSMNTTSSYEARILQELETQQDRHDSLLEMKNDPDSSIEFLEESIDSQEKIVSIYQSIYESYVNKDYNNAYTKQLEQLHILQEIAEENGYTDILNDTNNQIAFFEYLRSYDLLNDSTDDPIQAVNYLVQCNRGFFNYLFLILQCFVLSRVFTSFRNDSLDCSKLLPASKTKQYIQSILMGFLDSFCIVIMYNLFAYGIACLFGEAGSWSYPFASYHSHAVTYIPTYTLIKPVCTLMILTTAATVLFVKLISDICMDRNAVVFISMFVLLVGIYLPTNVFVLRPYMHLIPTTYINAIDVVNGLFSSTFANKTITFDTGIHVLGITVLVLLVADISVRFTIRIKDKVTK